MNDKQLKNIRLIGWLLMLLGGGLVFTSGLVFVLFGSRLESIASDNANSPLMQAALNSVKACFYWMLPCIGLSNLMIGAYLTSVTRGRKPSATPSSNAPAPRG
jgi:Na+-driven multidrug efflux pump